MGERENKESCTLVDRKPWDKARRNLTFALERRFFIS